MVQRTMHPTSFNEIQSWRGTFASVMTVERDGVTIRIGVAWRM